MSTSQHDEPVLECSDSEVALLVALARGDCTPFWQYWMQHRDGLLAMCRRWLGAGRHDAEDVLNTGALKIIDYLYGKQPAIRNFRSWLVRILHNLCIDVLRDRQRHEGALGIDAEDGAGAGAPLWLQPGEQPDGRLYRRELQLARRTAWGAARPGRGRGRRGCEMPRMLQRSLRPA